MFKIALIMELKKVPLLFYIKQVKMQVWKINYKSFVIHLESKDFYFLPSLQILDHNKIYYKKNKTKPNKLLN